MGKSGGKRKAYMGYWGSQRKLYFPNKVLLGGFSFRKSRMLPIHSNESHRR